MKAVSGILEKRYHNQFNVIYADILDVKALNSKGSAKQEAE
jgi:hypothetical protein